MILGISGKIGSGKDTVGKIIQYLLYMSEEVKGRYYPYDLFIDELETVNFHGSVNYEIKKFADKLKDIVCMLLGCTREQLEDHIFKNTELGEEWWYYKIPKFPGQADLISYNQPGLSVDWLEIANPRYLVKLTPRLLLQLLGTECGRNIIHPNIWINALFADYKYEIHRSEVPTRAAGFIDQHVYPNWIITDMRFPNEMEAVKNRGGISIRVNRPYSTVAGDNGIPATFNHAQFHPSETALDSAEFDYVIENDSTIEDLIHTVSLILKKEKVI